MAEKSNMSRKPKSPVKTLLRLMRYLLDYKWQLVLVVLFVIISSASGVAGTYFLRPVINDGILPLVGKTPGFTDMLPLIRMLVIIGIVYLVGVICSYTYSRIMINITNAMLNRVRTDLFNHMQELPIGFFDTNSHGELMSRYTSDVDTIRQAVSQGITQFISSFVSAVGIFVMMLILSPILTLLIIAMLFVMFQVIKIVGGRSGKYFRVQQQEIGAVNGYIEEMIEGQKVVKVFGREEQVRTDFKELNEKLRLAATDANTYANIIMPIMMNLSYVNYALTAIAGAVLAIRGLTDIGSIASFLQFTRSFSQPITQISQQFNAILAALAGAERIFDIIDREPEPDEGYVTLVNAKENEKGEVEECSARTGLWAWKHPHEDGTTTYTRVTGSVVFEDVTFGYEKDKVVLDNISLYAKPGQKIAFVGSTGAGKTTITNLINRFYDIDSGKIRYDGINIRKIKKDDLRRSLAMVLQDTHLFTGSVKDNIRYGKLDATDEEVMAAAKLANADYFIRHLPQGYDTMLYSDGSNLSQGQRQLLSIARAAVADPPVLILDEATSSIDTRTESLIEQGMDRLMKGRTVFVIAHRLSTVRNSSAIMVLEDGIIIERGNHDKLLEGKGKYYQLYTGQFELS